jgi:hypothetical protein
MQLPYWRQRLAANKAAAFTPQVMSDRISLKAPLRA